MPSPNEDLERLTRQLQSSSMNGGSGLSADGAASVAHLKTIQDDYEEVFSEFSRERRALEDKYAALFSPLYSKRSAELAKDVIPGFWVTAVGNCEDVAENITEKDATALKFLKDITVEEVSQAAAEASAAAEEDGPAASDGEKPEAKTTGSYTLFFSFAPNPFFENETLTKTYVMEDDDDGGLDRSIGCKINWKPGKDLTHRLLKKKIRGGAGGQGKVITKKEPCDSFFNFFSPPVSPPEGEEVDEGELEMLEEVVGADFHLGETIRNDIIPRAVLYYLDEVENEQETDEDDDEEDDDDDAGPPPPLPPAAQNAEECKQQ